LKLKRKWLVLIVLVTIGLGIVILEYELQEQQQNELPGPSMSSLPQPNIANGDIIILNQNFSLTLGPGQSMTFLIIDRFHLTSVWGFIGCLVSTSAVEILDTSIQANQFNALQESDDSPLVAVKSTSGMCFGNPEPGSSYINPVDLYLVSGVIFKNPSKVTTSTITAKSTIFFERENIVVEPNPEVN
jgi:hypothetical protein